MRTFLTSLVAIVLSGLAGGLITIGLAVWSGSGEEYIIAFALTALIILAIGLILFVAQLLPNPRKAVTVAAIAALVAFLLFWGFVALWSTAQSRGAGQTNEDGPILIGLLVPGLVTILVHWAIVRWSLGRSGTDSPQGGGERHSQGVSAGASPS